MRPEILLVGVALSAAAAMRPAAAGPPRGRVVRVEETVHRLGAEPRLCMVTLSAHDAQCFGSHPELGASIAALDNARVIGTFRVIDTLDDGLCRGKAPSNTWHVRIEPDGPLEHSDDDTVTGVLDVPVGPRGHIAARVRVPPDRDLPPAQIVGIDENGDDRVEVEFLPFACDDNGAPVTQGSTSMCIEAWADTDTRAPRRLRVDRLDPGC